MMTQDKPYRIQIQDGHFVASCLPAKYRSDFATRPEAEAYIATLPWYWQRGAQVVSRG